MRKLGSTQKSVLGALKAHGFWSECGCGWVWDTPGHTIRILESLVKRGLVQKSQNKEKRRHYTYQLTKAGRQELGEGCLVCSLCGKQDKTVSRTIDPYQQDVHNEKVEIVACGDCYQELLNDI